MPVNAMLKWCGLPRLASKILAVSLSSKTLAYRLNQDMLLGMKRSEQSDLFGPSRFLEFVLQQMRFLEPVLSWRMLSILVAVPFPFLIVGVVDYAIPTEDWRNVLVFSFTGLALLVIHVYAMRRTVSYLSKRVRFVIRGMHERIFSKLQFMHFGFLNSTQTGKLLSKYAFDTHHIEFALIPLVMNILPEAVRAICVIIVLGFINPWLLGFVFLSIPIFVIVRWKFFDRVEEMNQHVRKAREQLTGQATEFISAIKLVRGFGQEPEVSQTMDSTSDNYSLQRQQQMVVNQTLGYTVFSVYMTLEILIVAAGGVLVIQGNLTIGSLMAMIGALPVILGPVNMLTQFSPVFLQAAESFRSIKELIDSDYVEEWQGEHEFEKLRGEIHFQNVDFQYEDKSKPVIRRFSLQIQAGEHVAFVGPSGSGKSTLVNLMLGMYAPSDGVILVDGVPLHDIAMRKLRRQCAIVMQDNVLLSGTVADNLRFGKPDASMEEVRKAAEAANALEFIEAMDEGFETPVGERGVTLSGGQRQRLAIARALLRDPAILILDEATSALDNESERLVQDALDRLAKGRTTITIAHRLSTIRKADRIVVLRKGSIEEVGTWESLAAKEQGAFKQLLEAQGA